MPYTKYEKETIITFNEAEDEAEVYTYNCRLINRLKDLVILYPANCFPVKSYRLDACTCSVPKSWIKINPPRKISEKHRKARAERMKAVRTNRTNKKEAQ